MSLTAARRSIEWGVIIVIGSALGMAKALDKHGAGAYVAGGLIDLVQALPLPPSLEEPALLR